VTLLLDERHKAILEATGHGLVLGGPGSGKTTLALLKAVSRIDKGLRPGEGILFLSFSRAAVARIADAVKDDDAPVPPTRGNWTVFVSVIVTESFGGVMVSTFL